MKITFQLSVAERIALELIREHAGKISMSEAVRIALRDYAGRVAAQVADGGEKANQSFDFSGL